MRESKAGKPRHVVHCRRATSLRVRRALLFYALKRLGLDVPPDARPASEQHIVLLNRPELEAARTRRSET